MHRATQEEQTGRGKRGRESQALGKHMNALTRPNNSSSRAWLEGERLSAWARWSRRQRGHAREPHALVETSEARRPAILPRSKERTLRAADPGAPSEAMESRSRRTL